MVNNNHLKGNGMKLYHGTNFNSAIDICMYGVDLSKSQKYLDFGVGFYTTPSYEHAAITAIRKTKTYNYYNRTNEEPYVVEVCCDFSINRELIRIKQFPTHSKEWSEFVLNNRLFDEVLDKFKLTNHNRNATYDIVYGEIADGKIINIAYKINNGTLLPSEVNCQQLLKDGSVYGYQYSFHTELSKACIVDLKCDTIKSKEKYLKKIDIGSRRKRVKMI